MSISDVAYKLNDMSKIYAIGNLQDVRKIIRGLKRKPSSKIFEHNTIFDNEDYAYHNGGRFELQFNIGQERGIFRYGVAFSLEEGKWMHDASQFFSRIDSFNEYFSMHPERFSEMYFWCNTLTKIGEIQRVRKIENSMKQEGNFIFIGKFFSKTINDITDADCYNILETFDELLDVFIYVENKEGKTVPGRKTSKGFNFKPGFNNDLPDSTLAEYQKKVISVDLRHNKIKKVLCKHLTDVYGQNCVGDECITEYGSRVDAVVIKNGKRTYYELKVSDSIRACIREALPQLLEYAYWPEKRNADKLVIVSENDIIPEACNYLYKLRKEFHIPVYYQKFNMNLGTLDQEV